MRKSQILWYLRQIFYEINEDFLFPGNLVSLSVITRASLDFKTSFLRLVELVIFTVLNIRLRRDANNGLLLGNTCFFCSPLFLKGCHPFRLRLSLHYFEYDHIQWAHTQWDLQTSGECFYHLLWGIVKFTQRKKIKISTNRSKLKNVQIFPVLVPLLLPVTQICLTGSLYTVLAVAIERFLAVTRYFCHRVLLSNQVLLSPCTFVTGYTGHVLFNFWQYGFQWEDLKVKILKISIQSMR